MVSNEIQVLWLIRRLHTRRQGAHSRWDLQAEIRSALDVSSSVVRPELTQPFDLSQHGLALNLLGDSVYLSGTAAAHPHCSATVRSFSKYFAQGRYSNTNESMNLTTPRCECHRLLYDPAYRGLLVSCIPFSMTSAGQSSLRQLAVSVGLGSCCTSGTRGVEVVGLNGHDQGVDGC